MKGKTGWIGTTASAVHCLRRRLADITATPKVEDRWSAGRPELTPEMIAELMHEATVQLESELRVLAHSVADLLPQDHPARTRLAHGLRQEARNRHLHSLEREFNELGLPSLSC